MSKILLIEDEAAIRRVLVKILNEENKDELTLTLTPEICLKTLRRISDDDVEFMGFSSTWYC